MVERSGGEGRREGLRNGVYWGFSYCVCLCLEVR